MTPERITVMLVGQVEDDGTESVFDRFPWSIHRVPDCLRFLMRMFAVRPEVVICEQVLPDGTWKDILGVTETLYSPPSVVVVSRLADDDLWAEVLTEGGYDSLAKPLDPEELRHVVEMGAAHAAVLRKPDPSEGGSGGMAP
jgi:FixJ family two-component response regulator